MKTLIKELCKKIEKEEKIKILFAVENGSRAWRMESEDSDFDVRFVFVKPIKEYIQIHIPGDVISKQYNKKGKKVSSNGFIDFSGFDVFKATKLLSSSNPAVIEWLTSDIVYYGKQNQAFKKFAVENFNPISLYYHYKSMCRQNYLKYLKSGDAVTYKKYLYAMRGLINAKWVAKVGTLPPIDFKETLKKLEKKKIVPKTIIKKLFEIIELKKTGKEKQIVQNIVSIDNFIEKFLKDDSECPKKKQRATYTKLNNELRKIVLKRK